MKRSSAMARTRRRLPRAKSTSLRSIVRRSPWLLLDRVLEDERVRDDPFPGLEAGHQLLHLAGEHLAADNFLPLEAAVANRDVHPFAIVQVEDSRRGHDGALLGGLTVERCRHEHAETHQAGIGDLDAHLGGANRGFEARSDIADASR